MFLTTVMVEEELKYYLYPKYLEAHIKFEENKTR